MLPTVEDARGDTPPVVIYKPNRKARRDMVRSYKMRGDLCRRTRGAKAHLRSLNLACDNGLLVRAN